jgi:hypothetical protein
MKKFISSLVVALALVAVVPGVASAHHNNSQLCYDYDHGDYEYCDHSHLNNNYYGSYNGYYSGYGYYNNYNTYNNYNRYATQTYYKPVSRYACDYTYYYGNVCSYQTDYVKSYREVPVTGYTYDTYSYNYSNYPYNYYNNYGYGNYTYGYSYPYNSAYYGSYWY